ncbi:MAG: glycosyltransferase family 39 protein, partial [Acidobacteriota bacterium]
MHSRSLRLYSSVFDEGYSRAALLVFLLLSLVFIGFRLWQLTNFSLWTDEIFSVGVTRLQWGAMLERLVLDKVHPPLFYLLLKVWVSVGGEALLWLKLFPVLTAVATIIPFYFLCCELNLSAFAMNATMAMMSVNGYLVQYAQEVRMYSLLILLATTSCWLYVRFANRDLAQKKHLLLLSLVNLLLIYTHYFGWLVVGVQIISMFLLDRRKFLMYLVSVSALILCFTPWIYFVVEAILNKQGPVSGLDWIGRPALSSVNEYFAVLTGALSFPKSTYVRLLLFGIPSL